MYRQSYDTFDTHLTCVKVCVKAMIIFDLDFDQDQIQSKSDFSCRVKIPYCINGFLISAAMRRDFFFRL